MAWNTWSEETMLSKALSAALAAEQNKENQEGERMQNAQNEERSLEVAYFCSRIKDKVTTVLELKPVEPSYRYYGNRTEPPKLPPLRLVCVIDVSHSMLESYGPNERISKLDKIKLFMQLLIKTIGHEDHLSIITFGTKAKVLNPLQKMSVDVKEHCLDCVHNIAAAGVTNMGAGIFAALDQFNTKSYKKNPFYDDNILLFTDGMANEGITETSDMLREIRTRIKKQRAENHFERDYCIKLCTLGTGGFLPELLFNVGQEFSTDAFYFLDENESMEMNLMRPIALRQTTVVSVVKVKVTALNGAFLKKDEMSREYEVRDDTAMADSNTSAEYMIHDIASGMERHLVLSLGFPKKHKKLLKGKNVLSFEIHYRDSNTESHSLERTITYEEVPRKENKNKEFEVVMTARHDCRLVAKRALDMAAQIMLKLNRPGAKNAIQDGINEINDYSAYVANLLTSDETYNNLMQYVGPIVTNLEYCVTYLGDFSVRWDDAWGRLKALSSSIAREVPSSRGVYAEGAELFSSEKLQEKLDTICKGLRELYQSLGLCTEMLDKYLSVIKELEDKLEEKQMYHETSF